MFEMALPYDELWGLHGHGEDDQDDATHDPPPVFVVCCGNQLQICIDNMVECPDCGTLHRVEHTVRENDA